MTKMLRSKKLNGQTLLVTKLSLIFILMLASIQILNAQTIPYPLSKLSKNYKPDKTQPASATSNSSSFIPSPTAGSWSPVVNPAPYYSGGGMLLLSDGTVLAKSYQGGSYGNLYMKLTPDASGSYANGTWSTISPMHYDRLYYSSQVLKDGRVYVAGGEYGDGESHGEVYDPLTNTWTLTPDPGIQIADANSEILNDGRVLQGFVFGTGFQTAIYDPSTNTYSTGPNTNDYYDEAAWVKLPDNSILMVNVPFTGDDHSTERYIPSTNTWVTDAPAPVSLYDLYGYESGAAFLLPNGKAFFLGSTGHTAIYTPSGSTANGSWVAGPDIPGAQGTPDAAAAMMVNGIILCAVSPVPTSANHFPSPTAFYEYDYVANTFTQVGAPGGGTTNNYPSYVTSMLDLPDGNVLYSVQGSTQYFIYTPNGTPLAAGKPTIGGFTQTSCYTYNVTGKGFNGISEGAGYGDDWQMETNYPIIRLTSGTHVYYCRTTNWNSTGVMRGSAADSVTMTLPAGIPDGNYSMVVTANGIASDPVNFTVAIKNCLCSPPLNLAATNLTTNSATISWDPVTNASKYILYYKESSSSTWITKYPTTNKYKLTGLLLYTNYDVKVQTKCSDLKSNYSKISFRTTYGGPTYCTIGGVTSYEDIDKVILGSISNKSGNNNGYGDYTALSTNLVRGSSAKITLKPGFNYGGPYDEFWSVYIDYNQNGSFADAGELVKTGDSTGQIVKTFTVKAKATLGYTRMRIVMHYSSLLGTSCGAYQDGEAEDYTVNIVDASPVAANTSEATAASINISSMLVMPNPVQASSAMTILNLTKQGNVSLKITDLAGRTLYQQQVTNAHAGKNIIAMRGLNIPNGVYVVQANQEGILVGRAQIVVSK